jgi:tetratricopeptide (TPR) repeat protein
MNAPQTVAVSVLAAAAVAAGAALLDLDRAEAAGATPQVEVLSDLALRVEVLAEDQRSLAAAVDALAVRPAPLGAERRSVGEIEAAVERYLAQRAAAEEVEETAPERAAAASFAALDVQSILATLRDPERDWLEKEELWQLLREEGRLDEVIAEYERLAALDPNDPDRKVDLGYAYIQKIQEVGGTLAGKWATMADEQFDAALALDETHWKARFMKAMSLSHWPAFTGKTVETIAQFEKLIEIQDQGPAEEHHVQTYLMLGNIYLGQGKNDLALKAWQKGLALFPGNAELSAQIASIQQQ